MENLALITEFKDDKLIDRVTLMAILEDVFRNALKKKYGSDENFDIIINPDKGDMEIWRNRVVVADGEVEEPNEEISLSEARKIEEDFEIGEDVSEEVKLMDLGRRSILALRQNLIAKIHEHDNTNIYKQFKDLEGEIYTAEVHHIRHRAVILLDDEGHEIILPKDKQIPSDFFRKGDNVRGIIESVELKGNKPAIIMSRANPLFLEKLFEQEIPEVFDGLITVKKWCGFREKAKVAVFFDIVLTRRGLCGNEGRTVNGVMRHRRYQQHQFIYYSRQKWSLTIDDELKRVEVILKPEEVSKAIGRGGHNIRLAGQLTGYEIDVLREGAEEDVELTEISDEIETWIINEFKKIGLDTAKSVLEKDLSFLVNSTDLEEETIIEVVNILKEEFEE